MITANALDWWQRSDLGYQDGLLTFAGQDVSKLAHRFGTPSFVYSFDRVVQNLNRLHSALDEAGFSRRRVLYAMKANRFAPLLTMLKQSGLCGIDACSPNEVVHAMSSGFLPEEISFTAGSLSEKDFSILSASDGISFTCDSLHAIRRWGELKPSSKIAIRINPATGISRSNNDKLQYAGNFTSKFGIYREQFQEALDLADQKGLLVDKIHFHTGCGYLNSELPQLHRTMEFSQWFLDQAPTVSRINIGGGLGVPHEQSDQPLDLHAWSSIIAEYISNDRYVLEVEPGDYIAKDAGILLLRKTYLETKRDTLFLGTDAGFNICPEPAYYKLPFQPVSLQYRGEAMFPHHVTGNINEALDIWAENALLPDMSTQEFVVLINAGAYSSSMASNHCMRGEFKEFMLV